jgi:hypothetical protein
MNNLLKTEQAMQLVLCIFGLYYQPLHFEWWQWILLFFSPDLSMAGYLLNVRVGAVLYNLAHHKAVAGLLICFGILCHFPILLFVGLLLWAHSSFDRLMGYGLKYMDSFQHTHLGLIGKK